MRDELISAHPYVSVHQKEHAWSKLYTIPESNIKQQQSQKTMKIQQLIKQNTKTR